MNVHRPTVGILALVLLIAGGAMYVIPGLAGRYEEWSAGFVRIGLAMGALWLALPELKRMPAWLLPILLVSLLVLARWPRYFLVAIVITVAYALLRPRVSSNRANSREMDRASRR